MAPPNTARVFNIPHVVEEGELLQFLEDALGENTIKSCKILRHQDSGRSKGKGFVQFRDGRVMATALEISNEGKLSIYNQDLKLLVPDDILVQQMPPTYFNLEHCKLYVGCLTSSGTMLSFWRYVGSLKVEINSEEETLSMQLGFTAKDYKLEFPYSEIWQLTAARLNGRSQGFLVQVRESPPSLYCRPFDPSETNDKYVDVFINGCLSSKLWQSERESWGKVWVRTTDFTVSNAIGQSSSYVVELDNSDLPQDISSVLYLTGIFSPVPRMFSIEKGVPYAASQVVVPMVNPENFRVPFDVLYKVNNLIQFNKLCGPTLDERFFKLISTGNQSAVKLALQAMSTLNEVCYDPVRLLKAKVDEIKKVAPPANKLEKGKAWIHRLLVTPTKVYCLGPEVEQSNRIIRQHQDYTSHFLRVNFVDENCSPLTSTVLTSDMHSGHSDVYRRVKEVLKEGIFIGSRKYEFLAFSASQLRDSQIWMFAEKLASTGTEKPAVTADSIRTQMGDFSQIRNVAKCAARMGQCFSSSIETRKVLPLQVKKIKDITIKTDGVTYCFSDGIGKISQDFARSIAGACCPSGRVPSAFQIRYGGYKGVVAVDPRASSSFKLYLRPSMHKFDSPHMSLEVLDWTRVLPCFLNRQVICLLSTLGVKDLSFIHLQSQMISELEKVVEEEGGHVARRVLGCRENRAGSIALQMLENGYTAKTEPLLKRLLCVFREAELQELKTKAKIFVPKGRCLMGCLDETKTLKYGEVFVQISAASKVGDMGHHAQGLHEDTCIVTSKVFVAKNPCLHPGDVRVLQAVDVANLHHMVNCVVFPQLGPKPHPHECSGSDLDGDIYMVSWDASLIPPTVEVPMDYSPPAATSLDHPVTIEEIQDFFLNYMTNDNLGIIANAHVVHADKEIDKARSEKCYELAHLASLAVDYPKTGVPARIPMGLRPREYPDFMEKEHKVTYISSGILGKLYRYIKDYPSIPECSKGFVSRDDCIKFFDKDLKISGYEKHIESALLHKNIYDMKLIQLMNHYGIRDEAEIMGGHVISLSRIFARKQMDVLPKVRMAFEVLKHEARRRVGYGGSDSSSSSSDSFASNSFGPNGHPRQQGAGGAGAAAAAAGSTAGNYYQHGQSARSPPASSAASHNNRVQPAGAGAGPGLSPGPFGSGFPSSSGIVVSNQVLQHSGKEAGASKHERALELSADAAPFVPAVKRGSYDQALPQLGGAGEAEPSVLRDHSNALDHNIEGHFHHRDLGGRNENRDTAVAPENREPERPSVSDCRSSTGDAERDANGEAGALAYDHGRDGGDSTAASSAFYVPMEPEWEEDDLYLRYRSDALRTARERDRFARGASQAYIRGDHRRAKTMSKQAQERRLLAERLNAEAAHEILNQRNNDASRNIWHIDLHGLHTGEAVAALENRLIYIESEILSSGQTNTRDGIFVPQIEHEVGETSNLRAQQDVLKHKHTQSLITAPRELVVITGVGVHSQGGPTIPFAVKNFLLTNGYQFAQNTPGSFSVRPKLRLSV